MEDHIEVYIALEDVDQQQFLASSYISQCLRRQGIPVIGCVGVISVETGRLTMSLTELMDEPCLLYSYTGPLVKHHLRKKELTLEHSLAQIIEEENDL